MTNLSTQQIEAAANLLIEQRIARTAPAPAPLPPEPRGKLARLYPATQEGLDALQVAVDAAGSPYQLGIELGYSAHAARNAVCNRHRAICKALGQWDLPTP